MTQTTPAAFLDQIQPLFPKLVDLTNKIVFDDIWKRPQLSPRERSLITIAALVALARPDRLVDHLHRGLANGLTPEEIAEVITHLAIYAGWPAAMTAVQAALPVLQTQKDQGQGSALYPLGPEAPDPHA